MYRWKNPIHAWKTKESPRIIFWRVFSLDLFWITKFFLIYDHTNCNVKKCLQSIPPPIPPPIPPCAALLVFWEHTIFLFYLTIQFFLGKARSKKYSSICLSDPAFYVIIFDIHSKDLARWNFFKSVTYTLQIFFSHFAIFFCNLCCLYFVIFLCAVNCFFSVKCCIFFFCFGQHHFVPKKKYAPHNDI